MRNSRAERGCTGSIFHSHECASSVFYVWETQFPIRKKDTFSKESILLSMHHRRDQSTVIFFLIVR